MIKRLQEKLSSLSGVRLERSADALGMLWEELSKAKAVGMEEEQKTSSSASFRHPQFLQPSEVQTSSSQRGPGAQPKVWGGLKTALLHSIYTGTLVDKQFFAKGSRNHGGSLQPIYMSSIVAGRLLHSIQGGMCHRVLPRPDEPNNFLVSSRVSDGW